MHRSFSVSGFHVNVCVSSDLISEFHLLILTIWCVDNSPGNYPQQFSMLEGKDLGGGD